MIELEIVQIVGIALIAAFLAIIIKEQKPTLSFFLVTIVGSGNFLFIEGKN